MRNHSYYLIGLGLLLACTSKDYCVETGCPSPKSGGAAGQQGQAGGLVSSGGLLQTSSSSNLSGSGGVPEIPGSTEVAYGGSVSLGGTSSQPPLGPAGTYNVAGASTIELPCNGLCTATKPLCVESTATCVQCQTSEHCKGVLDKPVCDNIPGSLNQGSCVQCLSNKHCTDPGASFCDTALDPVTKTPKNVCAPCVGSGDCQHLPGEAVCLSATEMTPSMCVQCSAENSKACKNSAGVATLCHSTDHVCTDFLPKSVGLCDTCISDAQCMDNQACAQETFVSELLPQYACFWRKGTTAAPDCSGTQPYAYPRLGASIDGTTVEVCGLGVSTCAAWREYRSPTIDCAPDGLPVHEVCTFHGVESARCVQDSSDQYHCAPRCSKQIDCFSFSKCLTDQGQFACL